MADIRQAAEWLKAGYNVRRTAMGEKGGFTSKRGGFVRFHEADFESDLHVYDLLADDWEKVDA